MKRIPTWLIWVVAILLGWKLGWGEDRPYSVMPSVGPENCIGPYDKNGNITRVNCVGDRLFYKGNYFQDCEPIEACADVAFALNEAHENRKAEEEYRKPPKESCNGTINAPCKE